MSRLIKRKVTEETFAPDEDDLELAAAESEERDDEELDGDDAEDDEP